MRVQLAVVPKTRIHFGESEDGGYQSPKEEKYHKMRYQFYLQEDTIQTNYQNDKISWRKMNKQLRQLAKREEICMGCFGNNFDSNMKPIEKNVKKSQAVFDRAIAIKKTNSLAAKFARFISSI